MENPIDNLFPAMKIAGLGAGSIAIGVGAGFAAWWMQDALDSQIRDKPWLLPLLAGSAALGASLWMFGR